MNPSSDSITSIDPKGFVDGDRHSSIGMLVNIIQLEILIHREGIKRGAKRNGIKPTLI